MRLAQLGLIGSGYRVGGRWSNDTNKRDGVGEVWQKGGSVGKCI